MPHSKWKFRSVSSSSSNQLDEPQNSNRLTKRFSPGNLSTFDLSRSSSTTTAAAAAAATTTTTTTTTAANISASSHSKGNGTHPSNPASNAVDLLPDDLTKLNGTVNYHLSQVDRLKLELAYHNETIELLSCTNPPEGMECVAKKLLERIQGAKDARNLLAHFMTFHVSEVWRIFKLKHEIAGTPDYVIC
ncbi:hypothetical protein EMCG_04652 [[Emmonsia] crescens]|uniref:Uncharacterized protein n=1 Tax=[Emmonsia] crescens TaxID=73230 RepID=A0A0G2HRM4_9EURO|nr:hypothetical protein EMCG_04652 [Emmonsia crescens UAMH 3008]